MTKACLPRFQYRVSVRDRDNRATNIEKSTTLLWAMAELVRVGDQTDILGESPLWNELEQALYWIDIRRPALRRLDYASGRIAT